MTAEEQDKDFEAVTIVLRETMRLLNSEQRSSVIMIMMAATAAVALAEQDKAAFASLLDAAAWLASDCLDCLEEL